MKAKTVCTSLKVYVLYVHREYSTPEIAIILGTSVRTVLDHLNKAEATSRLLAMSIRKQRKLNMLNAHSKQQELKYEKEMFR